MATPRARRNNFLAGMFVLLAIFAGVVIVIVIGSSLDALGKATYTVRFPVETGVGGLATGSQVAVGGLSVGAVKSVRHIIENGELLAIEVRMAVSKKIPLRQGAIASLELPLLGTGGTINFTELGDGSPLTPRDIIPGRLAPPGFLASAGFGDEERGHVRNFLADAAEGASRFNDTMGMTRDELTPRLMDMVGETDDRFQTWLDRIDAATANIEQTTSHGPGISVSFEKRLQEFASLVSETRSVIEENRSDMKITLTNARDASESLAVGSKDAKVFLDRLNTELADRAIALLDDARTTVGDAQGILERADGTFIEQQPNIRAVMANARLASDQLRTMAAEIRRSPWRLVYRPNDRELEYELLYDSARLFAGAVGDLRFTSESLQNILDSCTGDDASTANQAHVTLLIESLDAAFNRYREAEQSLLDQLINE